MPNRSFYHPLPPPSKEGVKGKGIPSGGADAPPEGSQETFFLHQSLCSFRKKPGKVFLIPS